MTEIFLGIPVWKWSLATFVLTGRFVFFGLVPGLWVLIRGYVGMNRLPITQAQIKRETLYSILAVLIQIVSFYQLRMLAQQGVSQLYSDPLKFGYTWLVLQIPVLAFIADGFFYALHRALHTPWLLRKFHYVHHRARDISPLTNLSTHPLEAYAQVSIAVLVTILIPIYEPILAVFGMILVIHHFNLHSPKDFFPRGWNQNRFSRWIVSATYHHLHHTSPRTNYAAYFRCWDVWFGTEHENYEVIFLRGKKHA